MFFGFGEHGIISGCGESCSSEIEEEISQIAVGEGVLKSGVVEALNFE